MNYTDIENFTTDKGDEDYETTDINWRHRRGVTEIRCPKCSEFFYVPRNITFDEDGYALDVVYHFCPDTGIETETNDGWVVLAHLIGWGNG